MTADQSTIQLRPMTESEFDAYIPHLLEGYSREHVAAGTWTPENAMQQATKEIHELLPDGVRTNNHYLYTVEGEGGTQVGILWFARDERGAEPVAFVYDIEISPAYRRRGYGRQAFLLLEDKAREVGLNSIALHVFGGNTAARDMYRDLGYAETHVMMAKSLNMSEQ